MNTHFFFDNEQLCWALNCWFLASRRVGTSMWYLRVSVLVQKHLWIHKPNSLTTNKNIQFADECTYYNSILEFLIPCPLVRVVASSMIWSSVSSPIELKGTDIRPSLSSKYAATTGVSKLWDQTRSPVLRSKDITRPFDVEVKWIIPANKMRF